MGVVDADADNPQIDEFQPDLKITLDVHDRDEVEWPGGEGGCPMIAAIYARKTAPRMQARR